MSVDMMNLTLRQPLPEDCEQAFALVVRCETEAIGAALMEWDEHQTDWAQNPPENRWVVTTPDQQIVGYAILFVFGPGDNMLYAYVHSDFVGIGPALLQAGEHRAIELMPDEGPVYLRSVNAGDAPDAAELFTQQGYRLRTHVFVLTLALSAAPPTPTPHWPDGLTCRLVRIPDENRAVWELVEEGYAVPGRARRPFETWEPRVFEAAGFDPSLFYVVENEVGELVGALYSSNNETYTDVFQMVVRPDYRRRGIGLNLLYTIFREAWRRGWHEVRLNVSADNPTHALNLYQRAGMTIKHHFVKWEKVLREG